MRDIPTANSGVEHPGHVGGAQDQDAVVVVPHPLHITSHSISIPCHIYRPLLSTQISHILNKHYIYIYIYIYIYMHTHPDEEISEIENKPAFAREIRF